MDFAREELLQGRGKVGLNANDELSKGRKKLFHAENLHHSKNHEIFRYNYDPDNSVYEPPMLAQKRHLNSIQKNMSNAGYLFPDTLTGQSQTELTLKPIRKLDIFHSNNPSINLQRSNQKLRNVIENKREGAYYNPNYYNPSQTNLAEAHNTNKPAGKLTFLRSSLNTNGAIQNSIYTREISGKGADLRVPADNSLVDQMNLNGHGHRRSESMPRLESQGDLEREHPPSYPEAERTHSPTMNSSNQNNNRSYLS